MPKIVTNNEDRLRDNLIKIKTKPINEVVTFTSKQASLYERFHKYRGDDKISEVIRELIDLGLKSKGW